MGGGTLSDQQLKEFDAYLNGDSDNKPTPVAAPSRPEPKPNPGPQMASPARPRSDDSYIDQIVVLHEKKVNGIMELLDKIDAKTHKDIVADLVDEMQYQKGVVRREKEQASNLKKLFELAAEASKK